MNHDQFPYVSEEQVSDSSGAQSGLRIEDKAAIVESYEIGTTGTVMVDVKPSVDLDIKVSRDALRLPDDDTSLRRLGPLR